MSTTTPEELVKGERPEDETYPAGRTILYGLQHVMTMLGGIVAPPIIVGQAAGLSATDMGILISAGLLVSGLGTLLQTLGLPFFGSQLPVVQGISFVSVSTMVTIVTGGGSITTIFGSVLVAGAIGLAVSPFFSQVVRFFPPVVTGTIITTIGISLFPVAAGWMMGSSDADPDWGSAGNIGLAMFTLIVILVLSRFASGTLSRLSILLGLVIGTAFAAAIGMADFSAVGDGDTFALPSLFHFGMPTFEVGAIISMTVVIFIAMTETVADILAVGEIIDTKADSRRVGDGLRSDMITTVVAPVLNTFPVTTFSQNVGLVAITGIKSRFAVAAGGGVLVLFGLVPLLGRVVAAIPNPVLGGAGVVLFGSVAVAGIRTLSKVKYDGNLNLTLVATALAFGVIPIAMPSFYDDFPTWVGMIFHSGISAAAIVAVILNLFFNEFRWGRREDPSVFTAGSTARANVAGDVQERRSAYFAQLDRRRKAEHEAREQAERTVRRRSGHGRRSGSASAIDREADRASDAELAWPHLRDEPRR
ncbi:nucleobase:cation symporter-2 family protein [Georgenia sp. Z1491]|uniref:nucleobase:cation symporter-2 family protein n=1 Tax=Georgenia sp. Z1491 TaxID=3416707 RepID=UPI003CEF04E7